MAANIDQAEYFANSRAGSCLVKGLVASVARILFAVGLWTACGVNQVSPTGRACPCPEGWFCCPVNNTCVKEGDACELGAFTTPAELQGTNDCYQPSLTGDLLQIFVACNNRPGGLGKLDIWYSTRVEEGDDWAKLEPIPQLNSPERDRTPEVSSDGRELYFSSNRDGVDNIWRSTRDGASDPWSPPVLVDELSSENVEYGSAPNAPGTLLVICTNRPGTVGNMDIFLAERNEADQLWSALDRLAFVNTVEEEGTAMLGPRGVHLFWGAQRADSTGGKDLYQATRTSLQDSFETVKKIEELATDQDESAPWIADDLRTIFFQSRRDGISRIYQATR